MPGRRTRKRSGFEARVAKLLPHGSLYEPVRLQYTVTHNYTPDFVLPNGVMLEVKGWFKPSDRSKLLAVKRDNPDADIRLVFQRANARLNRNSKTTYAEWCDKHGFPWCQWHPKTGLPKQWIN